MLRALSILVPLFLGCCSVAQSEPQPPIKGQAEERDSDPLLRLSNATRDIKEKQFEKATATLLSLWKNESEEEQERLPHAWFLLELDQIKPLFDQYPPARTEFERLRDDPGRYPDRWDRSPVDPRTNWIYLNALLGEDDKTLAWFDTVKNQEGWKLLANDLVRRHVCKAITREKRWADVCLAVPDPLASLQAKLAFAQYIQKQEGTNARLAQTQIEKGVVSDLRRDAPGFYLSYLKSGNATKAKSYAAAVAACPETGEILAAMVRFAIDEGAANEIQNAALDDAEKQHADVKELRDKLHAALAGKK